MFTGRIGRLGYLLAAVYIAVPVFLLFLVFIIANALLGHDSTVLRSSINVFIFLFGAVYTVLLLPVSIGLMVRRWHDINQTGWLTLLGFIPVVSFVVGLVLLFVPSTVGRNKYGDPVKAHGFKDVMFGKKQPAPIAPQPVPKQPIEGQF